VDGGCKGGSKKRGENGRGKRGRLTEVVGSVETANFGGAFDAGSGGAGRVSCCRRDMGQRDAYIRPRLILPAMVNFSRCGMLSGMTMIQGKMAKKKSTRMVETVRGQSASSARSRAG
jgi:hypothetical protein